MKIFAKSIKMSMSMSMVILVLATAHSTWALGRPAPTAAEIITEAGLNVFVAGEPANAQEVNENIADLLGKINQTAPNQNSLSVDCNVDSTLLRKAVRRGAAYISFTGACDGPLFPQGNITLAGSGRGTSSINGVIDLDAEYPLVISNKSGELNIRDTTITTGSLQREGSIAVGSAYGSEVDLLRVDVFGPNTVNDGSLCLFGRAGSFKLTDVNISNCNTAVYLSDNSFAEILETGFATTMIENNRADYWPVHVTRNSSLRMRGGLIKGYLNIEPEDAQEAVGITFNSNVRIEGGVVEGLAVKNSSSAELRGGEVKDKIKLRRQSSARLSGSFQLTKSATAAVAPVLTVKNGAIKIDSFSPLQLSNLRADGQSKISIHDDDTTGHSVGYVRIDRFSTLNLFNTQVNATRIRISNSYVSVEDSALTSTGEFNFYNSHGYVEGSGSSITSSSSEGVGCSATPNNPINFEFPAADKITYPNCR